MGTQLIADLPTRFIAFALGLAPGIPIALVLFGFGRWRRDLAGVSFAAGVLSGLVGFVTYFLERALTGIEPLWIKALLSAVFVAAIPEELTKYVATRNIVAKHEDCDVGLDLILGSAWLALGFALFENVIYVFDNGNNWTSVALVRAILAVPSHVVMGILMGACLAMAATNPRTALRWTTAAYMIPIALHAAYDFAVFLLPGASLAPWPRYGLAAVTLLTGWILVVPLPKLVGRAASIPLLVNGSGIVALADTFLVRWVRRFGLFVFFVCGLLVSLSGFTMWSTGVDLVLLCLASGGQLIAFALFIFRSMRLLRSGPVPS